MKETSNFIKLKSEILNYSVAEEFIEAKQEWNLEYVYKENSNCICGHSIINCCVISNKNNSKQLIVGSVCVNNFLGIETNHLFKELNNRNKYSVTFIKHLKDKNRINDWEVSFLTSIIKFKKMSTKQMLVFKRISDRINRR